MIADPPCPICGHRDWRAIGTRTYRASDASCGTDYLRARFRVLFELWFPGDTLISLTSRLCLECGFITYTPRPTAKDIEAKYRLLATIQSTIPGEGATTEIDRRRSSALFRYTIRHVQNGRPLRVLDFGGGDGRLLQYFVTAGHQCFLIDYEFSTHPGVTRIGSTEAALADTGLFDLIICSHVIEHVAEPVRLLSALGKCLTPKGIIYIELPMEIWGKAPLHEEPVTHVNFFTLASCAKMIERSELQARSVTLASYLHTSGQTQLAIKAIACEGNAPYPIKADAERFLSPDIIMRLRRYALMPGSIPEAIRYRLKRSSWI